MMSMTSSNDTTRSGVSLAKGPVGLLGLAMVAFGVLSLIFGGTAFTTDAVSGDVTGATFLGVEGNGWTNVLWIASGVLLLIGAPLHAGAKSAAALVGLVLGAASTVAIFDGTSAFGDGDVFGIFATNNWTMLLLGASAAYLLIAALLPRTRGRTEERETQDTTRTDHATDRTTAPERTGGGRFERTQDPAPPDPHVGSRDDAEHAHR